MTPSHTALISFGSLQAQARAAMTDVSAWCRPAVMALIEGYGDEEPCLAGLSDNLSNASAALQAEGEPAWNDAASCPAARLEGAQMMESAATLERLSIAALREHRREQVRDMERTCRFPASELMEIA